MTPRLLSTDTGQVPARRLGIFGIIPTGDYDSCQISPQGIGKTLGMGFKFSELLKNNGN
jgi:hypothetical protein